MSRSAIDTYTQTCMRTCTMMYICMGFLEMEDGGSLKPQVSIRLFGVPYINLRKPPDVYTSTERDREKERDKKKKVNVH